VFGAGAGNRGPSGAVWAFAADHEVDGAGDPFRRVDPVRRRGELCGTRSAGECDQGEDDADHESVEPGTEHSGGVVVSAAGGAGESGGVAEGFAAHCNDDLAPATGELAVVD
jgi:hypothetical protein